MADTAIFDVDGTLVDTDYHHALAWYRAFRRYDITRPLWRIHRGIGMGGDVFVPQIAGDDVEREHGDALRDAWVEEFDQLMGEVQPFEATRALVQTALAKVDGARGVMIGDSTWDCIAAGKLGIPTIALRTGGFSVEELQEAGAAQAFESLAELEDGLDGTALSRPDRG